MGEKTIDRFFGFLAGVLFFPLLTLPLLIALNKFESFVYFTSGEIGEMPLFVIAIIGLSPIIGGALGLMLGFEKMVKLLTRFDFSGANNKLTKEQERIVSQNKSINRLKQ